MTTEMLDHLLETLMVLIAPQLNEVRESCAHTLWFNDPELNNDGDLTVCFKLETWNKTAEDTKCHVVYDGLATINYTHPDVRMYVAAVEDPDNWGEKDREGRYLMYWSNYQTNIRVAHCALQIAELIF